MTNNSARTIRDQAGFLQQVGDTAAVQNRGHMLLSEHHDD